MSSDLSHVPAGGSPSVPTPYMALQAKLEELDVYTHIALQQFPNAERHLIVADIRKSVALIRRLSIVAWKRYHKKTTLQELDVEVEVLRNLIRKSVHKQLGHINEHRYEVWVRHVNEIGRMVGGWIKSQT